VSGPADRVEPERKKLFLSRALLLGALAGSLETFLVLSTGVMPPDEIAFNFGLLVTVFGSVAASWVVARRYLPRIPFFAEDVLLVLVSIGVFALRGCLHNCGEGWPERLGIPIVITVITLSLLEASRRQRSRRLGAPVFIGTLAMTMAALDFAVRDGLVLGTGALEWSALVMLGLGTLSALLASRGLSSKLAWTVLLVLGSTAWGGLRVRPLWIEPSESRGAKSTDSTAPRAPNVILVVLDTVRADHLSLYGYPRKTSPNLDALAADSLVFDHAVASGNYSLPTHASLFTGLLPSQHGAHKQFGGALAGTFRRLDSGLADGVQTLAATLGAQDFTTGGVSSNFVYLARWTGLQQGFASFDDRPKRSLGYHPFSFPFLRRLIDPDSRPIESAEWEGPLISRAGVHFATTAKEPFFLFLNYLDAHNPYFPRGEHLFRGDGLGSDTRPIPAYDSEIAYTDAAVGSLIGELRLRSALDDAILVVTSDHGEFFGEHGFGFHMAGAYEEVLHVPLLVRYPKGLPPGRISRPFGLHEVHRLITDLAFGRSIDWVRAEEDAPRVLAQVWGRVSPDDESAGARALEPDANIVYQSTYKMIDRRSGADELFDLENDPNETHNLLQNPSAEQQRLRAAMESAVEKLPPPRQGTDPDATAADLAALRGLGYISLKKPSIR
jgi:arylsulfatase A-like enzyme